MKIECVLSARLGIAYSDIKLKLRMNAKTYLMSQSITRIKSDSWCVQNPNERVTFQLGTKIEYSELIIQLQDKFSTVVTKLFAGVPL